MSTAILWYRRDLRVHDHPALHAALSAHETVVPVFVFDPALLNGRFSSAARTDFMLGCVEALADELRRRGGGLVLRSGVPERELVTLAGEVDAQAVFWTSDVSPYARARDRRVTTALGEAGVRAAPQGGNYIVDVSKPRTQQGGGYSVFSPFFKAWSGLSRRDVHRAPRALPALPPGLDVGGVLTRTRQLRGLAGGAVPDPIVAPGEAAARQAAQRWFAEPITHYAERQNGLARRGTAQLSPYLRWGCLSARELERRAETKGGEGARAWTRQLCWRDFYAHVLLHWPENARHEFQARYRDLQWDDAPELLVAWQKGHTGYPIVDAAMRQLAQTGWMHNRARLIVGSFLTKDLHLDWRTGEAWFERLLLDGEPAQNNGNWQWIASVGTDPAPPARRMYNPTLQAQRFDPGGSYVRAWVPELASVPDERLGQPWEMTEGEQREARCRIGRDYPAPIVDHHHERHRALDRYRAVSERARAAT
jgi:deoxyribodipyrimidine photo-lyase